MIGYYDAISYTGNIIDSIWTMNGNQGTVNPMTGVAKEPFGGAGPGTVGATTAAVITPKELVSGELPYQMGTRRDIVGLTGKYTVGDWTITGALREEHKEGSVEELLNLGSDAYGGAAFALPVDYDTQRYDVSAAYSTPQLQAVFAYFLSNFTDHNSGVFLPYPYSNTGAPFQQTALYATPPSNLAQYVTAMVGYNVLPNTKVNVNARYGVEMQNDAYPANTGDPALVPGGPPGGLTHLTDFGGVWLGTSAASPNILAQVYQGNVGVTSTPITNLTVGAKYALDGRNVSIDQSGAVCTGSTGGFGADTGPNSCVTYVVPQEWFKQKVTADVDYRILPQSNTKVFANYEFDDIERSNAQVGRSWTNTGTLGLSSSLGGNLQGRVTGALGQRSGVVDFWEAFTNLEGKLAGDPSIAYYQAPYTMEAANARLDYAPPGPFSGGLTFKFENDNYQDGAANAPTGALVESLERERGHQAGLQHHGGHRRQLPADRRREPARLLYLRETLLQQCGQWRLLYGRRGRNRGLRGDGGVLPEPVHQRRSDRRRQRRMEADGPYEAQHRLYLRLRRRHVRRVQRGPRRPSQTAAYQSVTNYPNENTVMNALTAKASYKLTDNVELGLGAGWAMFHMNNWQDTSCAVMLATGTCGAGNTTGGALGLLTPGYLSPNYNVGTVMAMLKVKW